MTRRDAEMTAGDFIVALVAASAVAFLMAPIAAWLTAPAAAPAHSYCFRADPPPCEMTVRP